LLSLSNAVFSKTIYISSGIGVRDMYINSEYTINQSDIISDDILLGLSTGYQFDSNIFVELSHDFSNSFNFFDAFDEVGFDETKLLVGYSIPVFQWLNINPKIGKNKWNLREKEGQFLNPGPEESKEVEGTNNIWEIALEFKTSDFFRITLAYNDTNYKFGDVYSTKVGFKFSFNV
jgi:hypothetical protein